MIYVSLYYSNNEVLYVYLNNLKSQIKIDSIDYKINTYIRVLQDEYYKYMNKNIEMKQVSNEEVEDENVLSEEFEQVDNNESNIVELNYELTVKLNDESNIDESSINEEEFNQQLEERLNSENKKDL